MITNTAGTTVILNQNTTYSSATGLWTLVSPHALFNSGLLNYGRPLVGKMVKSSGVSLLPSGSVDSAIYYIFKVGNTIGLAATLEDASNHVPVKFYTSGELFSFVQAGKTYNLYPINSCCEPDYFETQYSVDSTYSADLDNGVFSGLSRFPIPCFLPKKISFTWDNIGAIDLYLIYYSANPTSNYTQSYRPFLIYGNGHDPKYMLQNTHRFQANVHFYHDKNLDHLVIRFTISTFIIDNYGNSIITQHGYEAVKNLTYDANNNVSNNIFETLPTFTRLYPNFGPSPATINLTPTDNYEAELLPASITLTKINEPFTVNLFSFDPTTLRRSAQNPDRGWTVNDYTNELPETIVLNKVSFSNYESANFITGVNVTNKIKLKLANSFTGSAQFTYVGYFGYLFYVHRDESFYTGYYLPGFCSWKFEPLSEDFYAIRLTMPTQVSYGPVQFRLFKMAGVLNESIFAPKSSTIYTDVFYMVQDPNA